jgi:hypothetical protein
VDHRGGDVENYERSDPCKKQKKREGQEYKSHSNDSQASDGSTCLIVDRLA